MPEIKHQFTGGKMNKDLDERLVPNGEYRDALNVQVSTSEDSDVGTVQNILGNSLIVGQDFIGANAVCVGSIADEKNDKLYYFISDHREMISNTKLEDGIGWSSSSSISEDYSGEGVLLNSSGGTATTPNYPYWRVSTGHYFDLIDGKTYELNVEFADIDDGGTDPSKFFLLGRNGGNTRYRPLYDNILGDWDNNVNTLESMKPSGSVAITSEGKYKNIFTFNQASNNNLPHMSFQVEMRNGDTFAKQIRVKNISLIERTQDTIIEYNSNTNTITPVLVDTAGDVLMFNPENIITSISIIDDLLFWTDNESEPKKINIQRGIEGTDISGVIHTNFVNNKRIDGFGAIEEEHITVIKKAPKVAPTISLTSERTNDTGEIYSGIMRIITSPTPVMGYDPSGNQQNTSSMYIPGSVHNYLYDFSSLKIGDSFDSQIETNLEGDSGFTLDWGVGDIILFKEFSGDLYDEAPSVPLTDYSVKGEIIWAGYNSDTDSISELTQNGDFVTPNYNGSKPKYWDWSSSYTGSPNVYDPVDDKIIIDHAGDYKKVWSDIPGGWINGARYKISIKISNYDAGALSFAAVVPATTFGGLSTDDPYYFRTSIGNGYVTGDDVHEYEFECIQAIANGTAPGWTDHTDRILIQFLSGLPLTSFTGDIDFVKVERLDTLNARFKFKTLAINNPPTAPSSLNELRFVMDKMEEEEKLFEFKFPRFAYRYQYEDREYSTMSPFSPIAFLPGSFDYHPKKGYNLGMTNRVTDITIKDFVTNVPDGVVAIDILYKDDSSPNIYVVDTIKPKHTIIGGGSSIWISNEYTVSSEQISKILPSNQLLRSWDNVPKKALAQDISGNRIIYGNYVQGFDLKSGALSPQEYYPDFNFNFINDSNDYLYPEKSIKSLREYQLGVVFVDEYGRETPVISNFSGNKKLEKADADKSNKLQVGFNNDLYPKIMKYFKFFIKETSGEYYNMAMDRYYDAEDGHVWLSFPSSDRNKIDIDTFLILKKGIESNDIVAKKGKYKVLDIQNEAPDFIKQNKVLIVAKSHSTTVDEVFNGLNDAPLLGESSFKMNYSGFNDTVGSRLHETEDNLYIEFTNATNNVSKRYRVSEINTDFDGTNSSTATYSVGLAKTLEEDVNFITDSADGLSPTKINDGTIINIYKYTKENLAKFDGRFFVKINIDEVFNENISVTTSDDTKYRTIFSKKLYYLNNDVKALHSNVLTGQNHGLYHEDNIMSPNLSSTDPGFGSFAPFFRNYQTYRTANEYSKASGGNAYVGQYNFGDDSSDNRPWLRELTWYTTPSQTTAGIHGFKRNDSYGNSDDAPNLKTADDHGWSKDQRGGKFNTAGEQTHGEVWFIDAGPYYGERHGNRLHWGNNAGSIRWIDHDPGVVDGIQIDNDFTYLNIAIGGVYESEVVEGLGGVGGAQFFNIGRDGGNTNYDEGRTVETVEKIYPGQKFRFREDPNQEIYTIQPDISEARKYVRWNTIQENIDPSSTGTQYGWWWEKLTSGGASYSPEAFRNIHPGAVGADPSADPDSNHHNYTVFGTQLSPNFTKGWRPKILDSNGVSNMNWDPTNNDTPGPIPGGLKLAINHYSGSNWSSGNMWVKVDELFAKDENTGKTHAITTNMILTSHSDGDHDFDGTPGKEYLVVRHIEKTGNQYTLFLSGYTKFLANTSQGTTDAATLGITEHDIFSNVPDKGKEMIFEQPAMNGYSQYSVNRINAQHGGTTKGGITAIGYHIDFVDPIEPEPLLPNNPAIWETEPKESTDLDIYYEVSGLNPLSLEEDTKDITLPFGSTVEHVPNNYIEAGTYVNHVIFDSGNWHVVLRDPSLSGSLVGGNYIVAGDELKITKPNGDIIVVTITGWPWEDADGRTQAFAINPTLYSDKTKYILNWHNCYSFGNGVESNRIRDNFNLPFISNGVKASTTLDEGLGEERRKYGLIYSGIYNSNSSTNNLNQFIAAEKITKDLNPIYGSIQKLHTRDSDLVTLCEDKCLRILADKDAVFNADGNTNLTATSNVLGQTIPFSGEYGISKNPESFASESYRVYFTDKVRGAVIRLSRDGLTPISMFGMKDWFNDNLRLSNKLIGSYDDKKDEYNITLKDNETVEFTNVQSTQIIDTALVEIESYWLDPN